MYKKRLYALRDTKTGLYDRLIEFTTDGEAIRALTDLVNDPKRATMISLHPQDFRLDFLGEWNRETGVVELQSPMMVVEANQLVVPEAKG